MSLRVWLPLNGKIENQGLSNHNFIINKEPVFINNGKIGQAMSTGQITMPAEMTASILNNNEFSFACWIYVNAATGDTNNRAMLFGNGGMTPPNNRKFSIFQYPTCNDLHLSWQNDTSGTFCGSVWAGYFPSYEWTHVAITYQNPVGTIYINGIKKANFNGTSNSASFEYDTCLFANIPNQARYLNDYRIYDHALSEKEVREIYKSLVLHYKLNDTNHKFYGDNIMPNSNLMQLGSSSASIGRWRTAGTSNMTRKRVLIEKDIYGFENSGIQVANDASCYGIDSFPLKGNTIYRISMKARKISGEGDAFAGFVVYNISDEIDGSHIKIDKSYRVTPLTNEWTDCWYIIKTNANATRNIYIGITTGDTEVTTQMCQVKIQEVYEIGDSTVVEDCSGYRNNGTIVGTIATSIDTPRYDQSSVFNGSSYIAIGSQLYNMRDEMTVNLWCKKDWTQNTGAPFSSVQSGGFGWQCNGTNYKFHCGTGETSNSYVVTILTLNSLSEGWHMLSATYDGFSLVTYIDGELISTVTKYSTKTPIYYNRNSGMFIGAESAGHLMTSGTDRFIGNISDVRVYATALTAEDIKELYQTSATIDENGNMYARELVE